MNKIFLSTLCIATLGGTSTLAQTTTAEKAALEEFADYSQTGEFTRCINHNMIKNTTIVDNNRIMFKLKGNKTVLSTFPRECNRLSFDRKFNYVASGGKICRNDMISTRYGSCSLGAFETLEKSS